MMRFFRAVYLRVSLAWAALCGRQLGLYRNILLGRPTAYGVHVEGSLIAADGAMLVRCTSRHPDTRNGFQVGAGSVAIGCISMGARGAGFQAGPPVPDEPPPFSGAWEIHKKRLREESEAMRDYRRRRAQGAPHTDQAGD